MPKLIATTFLGITSILLCGRLIRHILGESIDLNPINDSNLYLLAYSWQPEFCNGENYPGCSEPETYWKSHFTLHGLWPQYIDKGYPSYCSKELLDTKIPNIIGMKVMMKYWPNVQKPVGSSNYDDFWEHEWTKHGTCSGFKQLDYFNTTIHLIQTYGTPKVVSENVGKYIETESLRDAFGGKEYVSLQCNNIKSVNIVRGSGSSNKNNDKNNRNLISVIGRLFFTNIVKMSSLLTALINGNNNNNNNNNVQADVPHRLEGVYTCWSHNKESSHDNNGVTHDDNNNKLVQIICPSSVQDEDTCHSDEVYIQSFN